MSWDERAKLIGCHKIHCMDELLKSIKAGQFWNSREDRVLIKLHLKRRTWEKIAERLGTRSVKACQSELNRLKVRALSFIQRKISNQILSFGLRENVSNYYCYVMSIGCHGQKELS